MESEIIFEPYGDDQDRGVSKISEDVSQLAELFGDLRLAVEQQDPSINLISDHVEEVKVEVDRAEGELVEASRYQWRTQKLMLGVGLLTMAVGGPFIVGVKVTLGVGMVVGGYWYARDKDISKL